MLGGAADIGENPDDQGHDDEQRNIINYPHQEAGQGAHNQTKQQHGFAPYAVGQRAANRPANEPGHSKYPEYHAHLSHTDTELTGQVQGEEREQQCAAQTIDECTTDQDPELARVFVEGVCRTLPAFGDCLASLIFHAFILGEVW